MIIDDFRVLKIDEFNFVYERKYTKEKDGEQVTEWKRCKGFFGNISQCLEAIKQYILGNYVNEIDDYNEVLEKINKLNGAIINCKLTEEK